VLPSDGPPSSTRASISAPRARHGRLGRLEIAPAPDPQALAVFLAREDRLIRVIGETGMGPGEFIEVVLPEAPLRTAMIRYGVNVLGLSIIISMISAALVYFALNGLLVQPMMRITRNMLRFSQNPEDASRIIIPSSRHDEIGTAERELAHMQMELTQTLQQKNRLAALGLAVSKISHDLRNMLANAQLISDRLGDLPDPAVQRFAPKLIVSLGRAISLAESTLKFGRAEEGRTPSRNWSVCACWWRRSVTGWGCHAMGPSPGPSTSTRHCASMPIATSCSACSPTCAATPCRPSSSWISSRGTFKSEGAAMAGASPSWSATTGRACRRKARIHLFQAFQGSARKGGRGLVWLSRKNWWRRHGGTIRLLEIDHGAAFEIDIPDRGGSLIERPLLQRERSCDDREIRLCFGSVPSEFLDLNHTSKHMALVSLVIAKFARDPGRQGRRTSESGH
jgi:hypothetical protein